MGQFNWFGILFCRYRTAGCSSTSKKKRRFILRKGTDDEYRRFLELYELLDKNLLSDLANRAAASSDPDTREAGEDF